MKIKKLPVGIQIFKIMIQENYLYIDKKDIAIDLIQNCAHVVLDKVKRNVSFTT